MPTRHHINLRVPIPADLPPPLVIDTLQTFKPLLDHHHYIVDYTAKDEPFSAKDLAVIQRDPFFLNDKDDLLRNYASAAPSGTLSTTSNSRNSRWALYDIWEDVYWVPFLVPYFSRLKRYLAIGQRTEGGIRFRTRASYGVVSRGAFTVVARGTNRPYSESGNGDMWDGDTEKGTTASTIASDADTGSESGSESGAGEKEKTRVYTDVEVTDSESESESEPAWEILCDCEIEMPLILFVNQWYMRGPNRQLCEYLCRAVIIRTVQNRRFR
ncbi:hypothetical protein F5Y19DRAFT_9717 [Xylariaceae sp. FL1651]|nr:hypothetical protein F5Y19DRAFT_9717 [Xylariaceae sp. FL1651]